MDWASSITIDTATGWVETEKRESGLWRLRMGMRYLSARGNGPATATHVCGSRLSYSDQNQLWVVEPASNGAIRIRHHASGKYMDGRRKRPEGAKIVLFEKRIIPDRSGKCRLQLRVAETAEPSQRVGAEVAER